MHTSLNANILSHQKCLTMLHTLKNKIMSSHSQVFWIPLAETSKILHNQRRQKRSNGMKSEMRYHK